MIRWWRPDSLREKLLAVVGVATLVALLCALILNLIANVISSHNRTVAEMGGQAALVGRMTAPALEFEDHQLAADNLALFDTRPNVRAAAIYDQRGQLFATYVAKAHLTDFPAVAPGTGARLRGTELWISHPIGRDGVLLGTVFLRVHHDIVGVISSGVLVAVIVGAFAMLLAFLMIRRLDRHVTEPIAALAHAARDVVAQQDYSRRVDKASDDEVGELVLAFNAMLEEIERRTRELERSYAQVSLEVREREHAQKEVMRLNTSLEQRVEARTVDLRVANQALIEAKAAADDASRAKSAFLATMSHEIRTPMNGVIGMVDVLHQTSLNGHQVEMVELIRESGFSLLHVIDDILDFSRIESGRLDLEHAPLALADLAENVCVMLDHFALKKGVELTVSTDPNVPALVMGDALRLRQVLVNLVSNAIKFSSGLERTGRVAVRLESSGVEAGHARVVLRVMDNGIGIDNETRARLFIPFTQADTSTTRRFGGSGLGLAITRHLVDLMGGQVDIESKPGEGSVFRVRLSLAIAAGAHADSAVQLLAGVGCVAIGGADSLAENLGAVLADAGAQVVYVADAAHAREVMGAIPAGPWVWVVDTGDADANLEALAIEARHGEPSVRVVAIGRGPLREPRMDAAGTVHVDGNVLTRHRLVQTVTMALGRTTVAPETTTGRRRDEFEMFSRETALRERRLVLVAEDNETNQQVIVRQLGLLGFAADVAPNGRKAYEMWGSGEYSLVLTDLHMPFMDGYELTRAIRAREAGGDQRIPIAALTANTLKGEAGRCRAAGMDDYLSKPLRLADLRTMLEAYVPGSTTRLYPRPSQRRSDGTGPVNLSVLQDLVGEDPNVLRDFLQGFRSSAGKIAHALADACAAGNSAEAIAQAHKFKSSARTVGALALGELCEGIESAGKVGDGAMLGRLLPAFQHELEAVQAWLGALPLLREVDPHG